MIQYITYLKIYLFINVFRFVYINRYKLFSSMNLQEKLKKVLQQISNFNSLK